MTSIREWLRREVVRRNWGEDAQKLVAKSIWLVGLLVFAVVLNAVMQRFVPWFAWPWLMAFLEPQ